MKHIILILFAFISFISQAQSIKENVPDNNIQLTISPKIPICRDNSNEVLLSISLRSYFDKETDLEPAHIIFFMFSDACFLDDYNVAYIYLESDQIIELRRVTKNKCGNNINIGFIPLLIENNLTANELTNNLKNNIDQLKRNKWIKITFFTSIRYLEFENFTGIRNPNKIFNDLINSNNGKTN